MKTSQILAERIKEMIKANNTTNKDLFKELGIDDKDFLTKIKKGTNVGYINIVKIADKLNCSVDYLMGRTDVKNVNSNITLTILQDEIDRVDFSGVTVRSNAAKRVNKNAGKLKVEYKKKDKEGV